MTIDLLFIANNKLVACVNMCASNFGNKIFYTLTEEELEKFIPVPDDNFFLIVSLCYFTFFSNTKFYNYGLETCLKPFWAFYSRPLDLVHKNILFKIFTVNIFI